MERLNIREASVKDVDKITELIIRLKRLHGEFDPLLKNREDIEDKAKAYIENALKDEKHIILIAEDGTKVIGTIKADLLERVFYDPPNEGAIVEFYILPQYRRTGLGNSMIEEAIRRLKARGAEIITVGFPSMNLIAASFYQKIGFRAIYSTYAKGS